MEPMRHEMRRQAQRTDRLTSNIRLGIIDTVDPARHAAKVRLQPEDVVTGYLPVAALSVGPGWGLHALPKVGAQVVVGFQEGANEAGIVMGALFSETQAPPGAPVGSVWLYSESGARVQLNPDGSVDVLAAVLRIGAVGATFRKLVIDTFQALFNTHTHPSNGAAPTQKITDAHLTTNLTAS